MTDQPSLPHHHAVPEWSTLARHESRLLGQAPSLTLAGLAREAGTDLEHARRFWRAMGFADVDDDEVRFTQEDVQALSRLVRLLAAGGGEAPGGDRAPADAGESGAVATPGEAGTCGDARPPQDDTDTDDAGRAGLTGLSLSSALEVIRAQSFTMDRLVLWELEALVADVARRYQLDDTSARLVALDRVDGLMDTLRAQLDYAWRRHMAGLLARTEAEVASRGREETGPGLYPLTRSLGFVDIVSFTQRAQTMGSAELRDMLDDFENTARDVVTSRGARVVKTIGDAVMYIADDVRTGADVVTALVDALQRRPMMRVRASLVQGRVVSRSGDVFGPPVNLASRLVDAAEPGGIRMDTGTARAVMEGPDADRYEVRECHEIVAKGLGNIVPWSLALAPGGRRRS